MIRAALLLGLALAAWLLMAPASAPGLLPWDISDAAYDAWEREQYRLIGGK
jgi:hypothetical protein